MHVRPSGGAEVEDCGVVQKLWSCHAYNLVGFSEQRGAHDERVGSHDETGDARCELAELVTVGDYLAVATVGDVVPGAVFAFDDVGGDPGLEQDYVRC